MPESTVSVSLSSTESELRIFLYEILLYFSFQDSVGHNVGPWALYSPV